ncbi:hypothetical protein GVAV_001689 [Gurleya vavrai]
MTQTAYTQTIAPILSESDMLMVKTYPRQKNVLLNIVRCLSCLTTMQQVKKETSTDAYAFRCLNLAGEKYKFTGLFERDHSLTNF